MGGQFYDNALQTQHEQSATTIDTAGTLLSFTGPVSRFGRVLDVTIIITTALTVADTLIDIGENGGDVDAQLSDWILSFTGSAIGDFLGPTRANSTVSLDEGVDIAVDTLLSEVITDGGATAGDGTTRLLAAWW